MTTKGIYAGSFDPVTLGHLWLIEKGQKLFDELIIVLSNNSSKKGSYTFTRDERLDLLCGLKKLTIIISSETYIVDVAREYGATHLLRGCRSANEFDQESIMAEVNRNMAEKRDFDLQTVILSPPPNIAMVSSSFVKGLIGYRGWQKEIRQYVPENVALALEEKYK